MRQLRLALTIPGAVSLGAYEGGALSALIIALQALGEECIALDTISAASAGSMTAVLAARALLGGADPVYFMEHAWVTDVSLRALRERRHDAPLSQRAVQRIAERLLGPSAAPRPVVAPIPKTPIKISLSLTSLAGLQYLIPQGDSPPIPAVTYLDFFTRTLSSASTPKEFGECATASIASGANALGFLPLKVNRKADSAAYEERNLQWLPDDGEVWYTDGGTVDNEPLGRTIDLVPTTGPDQRRLFVLIHPDGPDAPAKGFAGSVRSLAWAKTGLRALAVDLSQSVYDDLRRLEHMNDRLQLADHVRAAVETALPRAAAAAGLAPNQLAAFEAALHQDLLAELAHIHKTRGDRARRFHPRAAAPRTDSATDTLDAVIRAATGLDGRTPAEVEVISPLLGLAPGQTVDGLLAGRFFNKFGGFLEQAFRASDFNLGYRNMAYWVEHSLPDYLDPSVPVTPALNAINATLASPSADLWRDAHSGDTSFGSLSLRDKWAVVRLAWHIAGVVAHDVRTHGI